MGARVLLRCSRINVNATRDPEGATPLWIACSEGHLDVVKLLLFERSSEAEGDERASAFTPNPWLDLNACTAHEKSSPFWQACRGGHVEIVKLLLALEPKDGPQALDVNVVHSEDFCAAFGVACYEGHVEVVRMLLLDERVDVNSWMHCGWPSRRPVVHSVCRCNRVDIVKVLLDPDGGGHRINWNQLS